MMGIARLGRRAFLGTPTATPKLEVVALKSLASKSPFVHQAVTLRSHDSLTPGSQPPSLGNSS